MFGIDGLGISDGQYKKRKQTIIKRKLSAIPGPTKAQAREDKRGRASSGKRCKKTQKIDNSEGLARMSWAKRQKANARNNAYKACKITF
jgi:hypothetical protein